MTDLTRTTTRSSDMDKKKGIIGGSETPVVTDKKVTTTPPTTSIGATAPSQSEDEYNEQPQTPQTPPQTMPAQPQPTQVAPTAPSLAAQPPGEEDEYNETSQAPPTTPAPAVTTTAQQYNDTDRRNQANLAAQTTTSPTANENMILQFDENNNPVLVKADVATPKITPKTTDTAPSATTPATEGEEYHTYRDILAKLAPQTSDEDKKKQMRRERRKAIVSALGDGLSALSNLYFTTKGAPDQGLKPGMTDSAKKRMDDLRAQWQKEKDKYQDLMLKGLEMDREQGNWLKSYELQKNADKRADAEEERKAKTFEKELPLLEKKVQAAEEELKKLIRENKVGDATWEKSVEVAEKELAWKEYELDFMKTHKGYTPKEYNEHLATERYRSRTLSNRAGGGGKSGKTYRIYNYNSTAYSDLTPNEVNRLYAALQSDGKVGKYSSLNDKVAAIQRYHSLNNDTYEVEVPTYVEDKDGKKVKIGTEKVTRRYKNRKDDAANGGRYDKMSTWTTFNGGNKSNGIIKINY